MSRLPLLLVLAFALSSCGLPPGTVEATVQLEKVFPTPSIATNRVVLYRVIAPADIAGKYGIAPTKATHEVIEPRIGTTYRFRLNEKDRQILSRTKPDNALTSSTEDFFDRAVPQKNK